jgi:hypothetical protein
MLLVKESDVRIEEEEEDQKTYDIINWRILHIFTFVCIYVCDLLQAGKMYVTFANLGFEGQN